MMLLDRGNVLVAGGAHLCRSLCRNLCRIPSVFPTKVATKVCDEGPAGDFLAISRCRAPIAIRLRVETWDAIGTSYLVRLWTVHPRYLDSKGLVAVWTEALLAQKILASASKAHSHHPQLTRFRSQRDPVAAIGSFLAAIAEEAANRHFNFDAGKISPFRLEGQVVETRGQLVYEWSLLKSKLQARAPEML